MKNADNIEQLIKNEKIKTDPAVNQVVLDDLLDKLDKAKGSKDHSPKQNIWSTIMKNKKMQLTAAAVIIIAAMIGINQFGGSIDGTSIVWADVVRPILNAKTVSMDMVIGQGEKQVVIHDDIMGSKILRTVAGQEGAGIIIDLEQMKMMTVDNHEKIVIYIELDGLGNIPNYLEHLQTLITRLQDNPDFNVEDKGLQLFEGKNYIVFVATSDVDTITIWVDPETAAPIRIIQDTPNMKIACENMQFDIEFDKALFSMEVPDGYTTQNSGINFKDSSEDGFIETLRIWAELIEEGQFPDSINLEDIVKIGPKFEKGLKREGLTDEEQLEVATKFGQGFVFIRFYKGQGQWHYAGKGVKLGDAETPIFWYQPQDSNTWRVIYGDLSVKDAAPDNLPQ
jgi:outer membrane lipoprotein-sorting protein